MPALSETIGQDLSNYRPAAQPSSPRVAPVAPPSPYKEPGLNVFLRCPLPPVWQATPDSLRQYYQNNLIPQTRLFNPPALVTGGPSATTINSSITSGGASGGGSSSSTSLSITNTSIKTTSLNAGSKFTGSFALSKAFELLNITATSPCRVQMYGTALAQSSDAFRPLDVSPPAGTGQNIICDIVLDTFPYNWSFQNREGSNSDSPVTSTVYLTVTNLDAVSDIITLSISYIPIVN
jgi:hypothetical protein